MERLDWPPCVTEPSRQETAASIEHTATTPLDPILAAATETSDDTKKSERRARVSPAIVVVLALALILGTLGIGFAVLRQNSAAGQWRQSDQSEVVLNHALFTRNDVLSRNLASAHATIASLSSQASSLQGQVKSLQIQLSSIATQQRLLGRNPVLTKLVNDAGTVSSALSMCSDDLGSLRTEIGNDASNMSHKDPLLQSNMHIAGQACTAAQQGDQQLQAALRRAE